MWCMRVLAWQGLPEMTSGLKSIASESIVLATLFFVVAAGFITLRFGALPFAKVMLDVVKEIASLQSGIKTERERMENLADRLEAHERNHHPSRPQSVTS